MNQSARPLSPRRVARAVMITIALVALAWLLWQARNLLFVLFFGVLVALFLSVFVDRLTRLGLPRVPALLLVVVVLVGLLVASAALLWPTVRAQLAIVGRDMPELVEQAGSWLEEQYDGLMQAVGQPPDQVEETLRADLNEYASRLVSGALPVLNSAIGAITGVLIVLTVGIYIAADPEVYRRGLTRLLPPHHRARTDDALTRSAATLRRWMIGTLIAMVLVGVLVGVGLWALGVPAPIALAVLAGLLEFIPIFGPILASVPAIAVAITVSPMTAVWVALLYTGIQQIEGNLITPLVMRGAIQLPPALTVLFLSFMAIIFGFLGLLLAVPILAAVMVLVQTLYVEPLEASERETADPEGS